MDLAFPKHVLLNNLQLRILYNIVLCVEVILIVTWLLVQQRWSSDFDMLSGSMNMIAWHNQSALIEGATSRWELKLKSDLCDGSRDFTYTFEGTGRKLFTNFTCPRICAAGTQLPGCILPSELTHQTQDGMFFTTGIKETRQDGSSQYYILPYEHSYTFNLMYTLNVYGHEVEGLSNFFRAEGLHGSSLKGIITQVLDENGKIWRTYNPDGKTIHLTLSELLLLSGRPSALDSLPPEIGKNQFSVWQQLGGPVGRVTGMHLRLKLRCYSQLGTPADLHVPGSNLPVCSLQVVPSPFSWGIRETVRNRFGIPSAETHFGVHVHFDKAGRLRYFDIARLLSYLTDAIVLLHIPNVVFRFFATHCVGHLSTIYSEAVNEQFSISQSASSLAMHILVTGRSYRELCAGHRGISLKLFAEKISGSLSDFPQLDCRELCTFCLFCFLFAQDVRGRRTKSSSIHNSDVASIIDDVHSPTLSEGNFMNATFIGEKLALDNLVKLFDHDRKVTSMERIFLPQFAKKEVEKEHVRQLQALLNLGGAQAAGAAAGESVPCDSPLMCHEGNDRMTAPEIIDMEAKATSVADETVEQTHDTSQSNDATRRAQGCAWAKDEVPKLLPQHIHKFARSSEELSQDMEERLKKRSEDLSRDMEAQLKRSSEDLSRDMEAKLKRSSEDLSRDMEERFKYTEEQFDMKLHVQRLQIDNLLHQQKCAFEKRLEATLSDRLPTLVASLLQQQSAGPRTQQLTHQEERKFDARLETALSERLPTLVTNLLQQHIAGRLVDELIHHQKREFDKRLETALCDELPTVVANLLQQQALPSKPWSEVHHRRPESQDTSEPKDGNSEAVSSDRSANCPEHNSVQCQHGEKSQFSMPSCMAARENLLPEKGPLATRLAPVSHSARRSKPMVPPLVMPACDDTPVRFDTEKLDFNEVNESRLRENANATAAVCHSAEMFTDACNVHSAGRPSKIFGTSRPSQLRGEQELQPRARDCTPSSRVACDPTWSCVGLRG